MCALVQASTAQPSSSRSNWGSPEAFTLTPGPRKPGADSFRDHRTLKFGKNPHHLKHGLAGGCRRVEALLMQEQVDSVGARSLNSNRCHVDNRRVRPAKWHVRHVYKLLLEVPAQRHHVRVARSTLEPFDQAQSFAAIHHCTFPGGSSRPSPSASHSALSISAGISIT